MAEPTTGKHGGARPGAGRKPGVPQKNFEGQGGDPYVLLAKAKAKRESYKAALTEIEYKHKAGELYDRGEVLRVIATSIAVFAEQIRSLPDKLEREAGASPQQATKAEKEIDTQLEALQSRLIEGVTSGVPQEMLADALRRILAEVEYGGE